MKMPGKGTQGTPRVSGRARHVVQQKTEPRALRVLSLMADGKSTTAACSAVGIGWQGFLNWVERTPDNKERYARARAQLLERMAEEIHEIADTPVMGEVTTTRPDGSIEVKAGDMIEHRKLRIEARKWTLSKLLPQKYGDRQILDHNVTADTAAILMAARKRSGKQEP